MSSPDPPPQPPSRKRQSGSGMPPSIALGQLYYWSARWQADERETRAELDAGEGRRFHTADGAIRWLLSED